MSGRKLVTARAVRGWLALTALFCLLLPDVAFGLSSISQGFLSRDNPPLGAIVSLQKDSTDFVSVATTDNVNNILGVVVSAGNAPLSLTSDQANQIQVASSGVVQVLVSDINGDIYAGDQITASPISGVGMKATSNTKVVGVAQDKLAQSDGISKQTYTDKKGDKHTVELGEVPVLVDVSYFFKQPEKTIIPAAIQNLANALAGKTVNSLPIIISMAIFIVTLIIVVSIIYSMIHGGIVSVGRNPMAQAAVYRNMIQLSMLILVILGVAVMAIYMVLSKL